MASSSEYGKWQTISQFVRYLYLFLYFFCLRIYLLVEEWAQYTETRDWEESRSHLQGIPSRQREGKHYPFFWYSRLSSGNQVYHTFTLLKLTLNLYYQVPYWGFNWKFPRTLLHCSYHNDRLLQGQPFTHSCGCWSLDSWWCWQRSTYRTSVSTFTLMQKYVCTMRVVSFSLFLYK